MQDYLQKLLVLARDYKLSDSAIELLSSVRPLVLCGVTGAGKNATSDYLEAHSQYERVVTHTTRQPRQGEVNGKDYWFIDEQVMLELIEQGKLLETEILNGDRVYGTSRQALEFTLQHGKMPLLTIDIQGAAKIAEAVPGLKPLFMIPPSTDIWMQRLGGRAYMSDGEHDRRLHGARSELDFVLRNQDFLIVINNDINQAAEEILRGVPSDSGSQSERRALAKELFEYVRSSNI